MGRRSVAGMLKLVSFVLSDRELWDATQLAVSRSKWELEKGMAVRLARFS